MPSNESFLLDTHIWFRSQVVPHSLKPSLVRTLNEAGLRKALFVSVISVWELAMLERDGKIELMGGVERWCQQALDKPGVTLLPYSPRIAIESVYLPEPMHKDPSDRILVASARAEGLTLVTLDKKILASAKLLNLQCLHS